MNLSDDMDLPDQHGRETGLVQAIVSIFNAPCFLIYNRPDVVVFTQIMQ